MKAEHKRLLFFSPFLLIAAWLAVFGDKTPTESVSDVLPARSRGKVENANNVTAPKVTVSPTSPGGKTLQSVARAEIDKALTQEKINNPFGNVAPPPPPVQQTAPTDQAPSPPQAEFRVIGRLLTDKGWQLFLDKNGQTWVATPNAFIDGFRVVEVSAKRVKLIKLSSNTAQIIPFEGE